jgi:hypothetical protein
MAWWRKNKRFQCKTGFKKRYFFLQFTTIRGVCSIGPRQDFLLQLQYPRECHWHAKVAETLDGEESFSSFKYSERQKYNATYVHTCYICTYMCTYLARRKTWYLSYFFISRYVPLYSMYLWAADWCNACSSRLCEDHQRCPAVNSRKKIFKSQATNNSRLEFFYCNEWPMYVWISQR